MSQLSGATASAGQSTRFDMDSRAGRVIVLVGIFKPCLVSRSERLPV